MIRVTDFFIESGDKAYKITYKGDPLISLSKKGLKRVLADNLSVTFFGAQEISELTKSDITETDDMQMKALKLVTVYEQAKRDFYFSKEIEYKIGPKDAAFKHFMKAVIIMERHGVTRDVFLESQIAGLKFVDNGRGTFPTPAMLSSDNAEDRLLRYLVDNNKTKLQKMIITNEDIDKSLDQNERFQALKNKIQNGVATLKEAHYVRDLLWMKKKRRFSKVEKYIEKLEHGQ